MWSLWKQTKKCERRWLGIRCLEPASVAAIGRNGRHQRPWIPAAFEFLTTTHDPTPFRPVHELGELLRRTPGAGRASGHRASRSNNYGHRRQDHAPRNAASARDHRVQSTREIQRWRFGHSDFHLHSQTRGHRQEISLWQHVRAGRCFFTVLDQFVPAHRDEIIARRSEEHTSELQSPM